MNWEEIKEKALNAFEIGDKNQFIDLLSCLESNENKVLIAENNEVDNGTYISNKSYSDEVFEFAPIAFIILDSNSVITQINKSAETLFSCSKEYMQGKTLYDFIHNDFLKEYHFFEKSLLETHEIQSADIRFDCSNAGEILLRLQAAVKKLNNDNYELIISAVEINDSESSLYYNQKRLYELFFEKAGDPSYTIEDNVYRDCNDSGLKLFGLKSKEEIIGKMPHNFSPIMQKDGNDSDKKADEMIQIAIDKGVNNFEWTHLTSDGKEVQTEVTLTTIEKGGKKILHAVLRDLTDRLLAESIIKNSEAHLISMINNSPDNVCMIDKNLRFIHINEKFKQLSLDVLGFHIEPGIDALNLLNELNLSNSELKSNIHRLFNGESFSNEKVFEQNGITSFFEISYNPILSNDVIIGFSVYARDISIYKTAENFLKSINDELEKRVIERTQSLSDSANFLQVLINTIPAPVYYKSKEGCYLDCNDAFAEFVGLERVNVKNKNVYECWPKYLADVYSKHDEELFLAGGKQQYQTQVLHKTLGLRDIILHKSLYFDKNDAIIGVVGILFDITERKILEDNLKKSKETLLVLISAIQEMTVLVDLEGKVILANETYIKSTNIIDKDIIGLNIFELHRDEFSLALKNCFLYVIDFKIQQKFEYKIKDDFIVVSLYPIFDNQNNIINIAILGYDFSERIIAEERLNQERALLSTLINSVPDVIYMIDDNGEFLNCNNAFQSFVGKSENEIIGASNYELFDAKSAAVNENQNKTVLNSGYTVRFEESVLQNDGTSKIYDIHKTPFENTGNNQKGIITISRDITELKHMEEQIRKINQDLELIIDQRTRVLQDEIHERLKAEEALKMSREKYRRLFNDVTIGIFRTTPEGRIILANPALVNMLGCDSLEELKRINLWEEGYYVPEDRQEFMNTMEKVYDIIEIDSVWRKVDGTPLFVREKIKPVRGINGTIIYFEGTAEDITDRKNSDKLREVVYNISEAAYHVQNTFELYKYLHQAVGDLITANNFYIAIYDEIKEEISFPYFVDEIESPTPNKLGPYPLGKGLTEHLILKGEAMFLTNSDIDQMIIEGLVERNGPAANTWLGVPLKTTDNKIIGALAVQSYNQKTNYDAHALKILQFVSTQIAMVISRKQIEEDLSWERKYLSERVIERTEELSALNSELERAVRTKDEFLANMSHELRTPLNAILGLSEIMLKQKDIKENIKYTKSLTTIMDSGSHLLSLINDILDLSKIEAGKMEINPEEVEIDIICKTSIQFVKQLASKKGISIDYTFSPPPKTVFADPLKLKQILINLLNNAVKFTPDGGKIGLDVIADEQSNTLYLSVWDTGIGINQNDMQKLFKPFVQLDSDLSREYEGSGLGLSLVSKLTELHGGSVSIESNLGVGSRFTIAVPLAQNIIEKDFYDEDSFEFSNIDGLKKALIIEDSADEREKLTSFLTKINVDCEYFPFESDYKEFLLENKYDIIFLDILLWEKSGWDILTFIKKHDELINTPVAVVTILQERARAIASGADGFLHKPYTFREFYTMVEKINFDEDNINNSVNLGVNKKMSYPLVLLAEDNEANLQTIETFLDYGGYRVVVARNGKEAVERAFDAKPDLILMDIQMPKMDGLEAIRMIRLNQDVKSVPIIALTALAMPGDRDRCLSAGANEYLSKPIGFDNLLNTMERFLNT